MINQSSDTILQRFFFSRDATLVSSNFFHFAAAREVSRCGPEMFDNRGIWF